MATLFNTLMTRMGQRLLQQYHYPDDLEWHWSLGYCQGDGCACVGHLDNAALLQLLPALAERQKLNPETQQALKTLLSQHPVSVLLTANNHGQRYTHSRGIQIEIVDFPETDTLLYQAFHQALRNDLELLCAEAEQQGYQLLDATLPPGITRCCLSDGHGILPCGPLPKLTMTCRIPLKARQRGMTRWTCCCTTVPVC